MTPTTITAPISTSTPKPKIIEIPSGLKMALAMFGVDMEQFQNLINSAMASGDIEATWKNIITSAETIQRVEKKLDLIINHLKISE